MSFLNSLLSQNKSVLGFLVVPLFMLLTTSGSAFAEPDCTFVQKTAADFAELQKLYEKTPKVLSLEIDKRMKQQTSLLGEQNPYLACIRLAAEYYKNLNPSHIQPAPIEKEANLSLLKSQYEGCVLSGCNRDEKFLGNFKYIVDRTCRKLQIGCEEFRFQPSFAEMLPSSFSQERVLSKQERHLGIALIVVGSLAMTAGTIFALHSITPILRTPGGCPAGGADNECALNHNASIGLSILSFGLGGTGIVVGGLILNKKF